jgi:DNA-binding NarL/FixJ family response regulator
VLDTSILLVDPTAGDRDETEQALQSAFPEGTILTANSYQDAVSQLSGEVDAVVTRYDVGDSTGIELTSYMREHWPGTDCFLYAETTEIDTESFQDTIVEFVPKDPPGAIETLVELIKQADVDTGQRQYPLPDHDKERVAVLDSYLDGVENVSDTLDRITKIATQQFEGATAAIAVLDERTQNVLAQNGPLSLPDRREDTINTYMLVHEDTVMTVSEYDEDPRFAETSFESEQLGSYLGAQIRSQDGYVLGTVSVYIDEPRTFSASETTYLQTLAELTADVLELNRSDNSGDHS